MESSVLRRTLQSVDVDPGTEPLTFMLVENPLHLFTTATKQKKS